MDFLESLKQIKQEMKKETPQKSQAQSKTENKSIEQKQAKLEASFADYIKDSDIKKI
ncbi:hypothetical protein [Campylobacter sp. 19-13652]|uniref:hypothetical protein n=1 Tax=Campylobacter sp. 19-13652 TaxID=2840180 RepID=UPI001C76DCBF|nr:hypothetical protein [Campylobacter sp. 19-13652]BCX79677.1 hypothetical protein LBC_11390 [Campylobacter sp. 19-13652]